MSNEALNDFWAGLSTDDFTSFSFSLMSDMTSPVFGSSTEIYTLET